MSSKFETVALLNLNLGNLGSIKNVLDFLNVNYIITNRVDEIKKQNILIIPGVGSFPKAMANIKKFGLTELIKDYFYKKKIMGICLGLQIFAKQSDEFEITEGLGLIPSYVTKFNNNDKVKIPHVAWNIVDMTIKDNKLINNKLENKKMYFNHSFKLDLFKTDNYKFNIGVTDYSKQKFVSAVFSSNFLGVQFHPELSGKTGIKIFENFLSS